MRNLGIDLFLGQTRKTSRAACRQVRCGGIFGKNTRCGTAALGTGSVMRRQAGTAAVAKHELGVLGTVAGPNVGIAIGAERGAVLYGLETMRADHGILFSESFEQSRLEHSIATPPQTQGTNSTSRGS